MNKKVYIIIVLGLSLVFFSGITYSFFNSQSRLTSSDQSIAKFVFNAEKSNQINLDLNNLKPGDTHEYSFAVTNTNSNKISDVTIQYQLTIKTYHFIPINIELYKTENNEEIYVGKCDETYSRNIKNELVCNMPIEEMNKASLEDTNYKLKISFPEEYNDSIYSNLVDYINVEIQSWQKI